MCYTRFSCLEACSYLLSLFLVLIRVFVQRRAILIPRQAILIKKLKLLAKRQLIVSYIIFTHRQTVAVASLARYALDIYFHTSSNFKCKTFVLVSWISNETLSNARESVNIILKTIVCCQLSVLTKKKLTFAICMTCHWFEYFNSQLVGKTIALIYLRGNALPYETAKHLVNSSTLYQWILSSWTYDSLVNTYTIGCVYVNY